jgi:hypothetical protein
MKLFAAATSDQRDNGPGEPLAVPNDSSPGDPAAPIEGHSGARTLIASAFFRLRSVDWDSLANVRVFAPWTAIDQIVGVGFEVAVPEGSASEVVFGEPQVLVPDCRFVANEDDSSPQKILLPVSVHVTALRADFDFRVRFEGQDRRPCDILAAVSSSLHLIVAPRMLPP